MKLAYGRMLQDGLDGRARAGRARASPSWRDGSPRCRRRSAGGAGRASTGSTTSWTRVPTVRQITTFAEGAGAGVRPRARARHRRLGAGDQGAAQRAPPSGVERVGRRRARVLSPCHGPGKRGSYDRRGGAGPDRPSAGAGQRDQQVGRHRGDDGAVPGGAGVAGVGAGRRRLASPRVHHRSRRGAPCASSRPATRSRRSTCRPRSAGASACSHRWGCCRRRWPASTSRALLAGARTGGGARGRATNCCTIRPRCTPRCTGPPTPSSARASTC